MGRLGKRKGVYDIIEASRHIENKDVIINLYGDKGTEEFKRLTKDT
ncbi:putative glycosytransferase, partial [Candidatus Gastranaerophilus sp. (ex Termes propinquus)]